ncbi:hypothetical protein [Melghirimyces algeriensis]|uniref:Uncharacterized protein n=1 Tax=Melghirimyces algeriensis TaxID=910412 RepID=A0A521EY68_9BACL|nr:hypothetical protein [Melghirimyces algeriensis]SMO88381.1 hypothetical protein SAMN06264849_11140 [Melghirimyces algeriensis]
MKHPFPTTQRNPRRSQPFSGYFVRWLEPKGVPSTSPLEERDAETEITLSLLCIESQLCLLLLTFFYF